MEMDNGEFKDVLYIPNLSSNLLSVYQITHFGDGHKVEFLPDSVMVRSLRDDSLVAVGKVNHDKRLYSFSNFVLESTSQTTLWHQRFGHLDVRYLQQLCFKHMVKGLPNIKFSKGQCSSCSVDMHLEEKYDKGKSSRALVVL